MTPKVKICGITDIGDALQAVWSGADALGFVFYKKSPRYITHSKAQEIISILPPWIFKVGLFVNENVATVKKIAHSHRLDFVQLHGDEKKSYIRKLIGIRIIKAIRLQGVRSLEGIEHLPCELLLFDTYSKSAFGGTGSIFDWRLASRIKTIQKPYIISGGLTPKNVHHAIKTFRPYAVDVSSGVETKPGKKDRQLLKEFIKNAKKK